MQDLTTVTRKGVTYFKHYQSARNIRDERVPNGRLVEYELGWAIQYWVSGPYYPAHEFGSR